MLEHAVVHVGEDPQARGVLALADVDVRAAGDLANAAKADLAEIVAHAGVVALRNDGRDLWGGLQDVVQGLPMEVVFVAMRNVDEVQLAQVEALGDG